MYSPDFQTFNNNQILVSSDRVTLYSKKESIFLFGTQAVSLSSKKTINLDAVDKVIVYAPKIELGDNATHPVVLGDNLNQTLIFLMDALLDVGNKLHNVSGGENDIKASMEKIKGAGQIIHDTAENIRRRLSPESPSDSLIVSKTTFTA
jgi:hypothetical protein